MIRKAQWEGQKTVLQACGRMKDSHLGQKHPEDLCTQGSQHTAHRGQRSGHGGARLAFREKQYVELLEV